MKVIRSWLCLFLLLTSAHRLPAPISEIPQTTPTPKPKREATHVSKPKPEATPKAKASSTLSFAGTWRGTAITNVSDGGRSSEDYIIKISDDEKAVLTSWRGRYVTISGPDYQATCIRFGSALSWSLKQMGENPTWVSTDTLRLNSNGTASFVCEGSVIAGDRQGITFNHTGTFSRQEKSATSRRR